MYFVPITKSVALIFLSLTLLVHIVVPSTRTSVVGKITTVMVSLNVIIIINRLMLLAFSVEVESPECVAR